MKRQTAADFDQDLLNLYDEYVHGRIDRRGFFEYQMRGAAAFAGLA
mgnify:CR=1 FL=1